MRAETQLTREPIKYGWRAEASYGALGEHLLQSDTHSDANQAVEDVRTQLLNRGVDPSSYGCVRTYGTEGIPCFKQNLAVTVCEFRMRKHGRPRVTALHQKLVEVPNVRGHIEGVVSRMDRPMMVNMASYHQDGCPRGKRDSRRIIAGRTVAYTSGAALRFSSGLTLEQALIRFREFPLLMLFRDDYGSDTKEFGLLVPFRLPARSEAKHRGACQQLIESAGGLGQLPGLDPHSLRWGSLIELHPRTVMAFELASWSLTDYEVRNSSPCPRLP